MCRVSETAHVPVRFTDSLHKSITTTTPLQGFRFTPQVRLGSRGMPQHYRWVASGSLRRFTWEAAACRSTTGGWNPVHSAGSLGKPRHLG
ncbi:MAG: hypothetical protein ACI31F_06800 [Muribaculaceae bacterium]